MIRRAVLCACIVHLVACGAMSLGVQNSPTTGTLTGTIRDVSGAVVPGVVVTARNADTNQMLSAAAGEDGRYRFVAIAVGDFEVQVDAPGFSTYTNRLVPIALGRATILDITLNPAGVTQAIAVTDQPPALDPTSTATTTTIDPERIEELPVNSRNYLEFTLLAPGVAPSNAQSSGSGGGRSGAPLADSGFTFGGLRPRSNSISIDGLDNTDATTGAARVVLSPEIVREFQIINNGLSAESGGAAGGAINVVTKSGSNDFHGDAFLFVQNELFNARDIVTAKAGVGRPRFRRYQPGFALGGPVRHDHVFFYVAGEQEHFLEDSASEISRSAQSAINGALALGTAPNFYVRSIHAGRFPIGADETEAAGKLTYLKGRHTFNSRFAFTNSRLRKEAFAIEEFNDLSARGSSYIKDYQLTGSDVTAISATSINEIRLQASTRHLLSNAVEHSGPEIHIAGVARFGHPFDADTTRRENRMQIVDNITRAGERHELKTGVTVNRVGLRSDMKDGFGGLFTFRSTSDFVAGRPSEWRQAFGSSATDFAATAFGAFVQDKYQPIRSLTINLGVRYDVERLPNSFRTDFSDISPRIGFAWSPSSRWIVRNGLGIYYDRVPLAFVNRAVQKDGVRAFEQVADETLAPLIFVDSRGGRVDRPIASILPSVFAADPAFVTPYSVQSNTSVERLISPDVTVRADYLYTRGVHLLRTRNINLPYSALDSNGRGIFSSVRPDPRFDAIYRLESSAASNYNGLTVSLNKRLSDEFELLASYTLSKAIDDASDFDEQPQNPSSVRDERALSRNDVHNRFVVSSLFDLPIGEDEKDAGKAQRSPNVVERIFGHIEMAPIFSVSSGHPMNVVTGADEELSRAYPFVSRPLGFARNALRTPRLVNVDLRTVKYVPYGGRRRLDFVVEGFNLCNHPNVLGLNPVYGRDTTPASGFRAVTLFGAPRQVRFSIDFEF